MRSRGSKMVASNCSSESLNVRIESAANRVHGIIAFADSDGNLNSRIAVSPVSHRWAIIMLAKVNFAMR